MANEFLTQCEMTVNTAAGRKLSEDEMSSLVRDMNDVTNRILAGNEALSLEEAAMRAAEELSNRDQLAKVIEARNKAINTRIAAQRLGELRTTWKDRPDIGLEAMLVGRNDARTGSRRSVASEVAQLRGKYNSGINYDFDQAGLVKFISSGSNDREIADAMWRIGRGQKLDGMTWQSVEAAKIISKWQESARADENRAGAWVGKVPGYIVRQSHDILKIRAAGYESWRNAILPRLDDATFDGITDREQFLKNVYDGLASGVHLSADKPDWMNGFKGSQNAAKRASQERVLHFKDGVSWHEYNQQFGTGSLREALFGGLNNAARTTGMMRVLGTNPQNMFKYLVDTISEDLRGTASPAAQADFASKVKRLIRTTMPQIDGSLNIPGSVGMANASAGIRGWLRMSQLGGAVISSFNDVPISATEMRYQGQNFMQAVLGAMKGRFTRYNNAEQKEILSSIGVYSDAMTQEIIRRISGDDTLNGKMGRAQQLFFKYNLMNFWTESGRNSNAMMITNWLAKNADHTYSQLPEDLRRVLDIHGIGDAEWNIYRNMDMADSEGRKFMTSSGIRGVPDEVIASYVEGKGMKVTERSVADARDTLEGQLRGYVLDRLNIAMSEPGERTQAFMKMGTIPGTVAGEAIRFAGQYKSFTASFMQNVLGREVFGRGYTPAGLGESKTASLTNALFRNGKGAFMGAANLFVWATLFGYVSMQTKLMLKGQTPRPPDAKTFMAAAAQGGGLGILGDFMFGEVNRMGAGPVTSLMGPAASNADSIITLLQQTTRGDADLGDWYRTSLDNTPFLNVFWLRTAMNGLILNRIQDALDPGSLERYQRRVEREQGNTFMLPPSQFMLGR
ncbi:hypothetical protein [Klebsiella michiganensis]|uniref:hypothetical protein n=1 Tax=Klebsiella michiganensis TaxID=1134687 RepID=UPI00115F0446|nr:hypothetical protein [Klebsiella michiganensis]EKP1132511.1 hypothetical protein [Klebsiella michiganensis]MBK4126537.1 hypothetical protein [Klebsiella michiganensis]MBZ7616397.1 hypothetical protein [Klebsiella michiganensis]HBM3085402.1 hypothetical protein [Klebsiella michiganensis]HBM3291307.1 hypothetical protein [Klebsiella michiganensis]